MSKWAAITGRTTAVQDILNEEDDDEGGDQKRYKEQEKLRSRDVLIKVWGKHEVDHRCRSTARCSLLLGDMVSQYEGVGTALALHRQTHRGVRQEVGRGIGRLRSDSASERSARGDARCGTVRSCDLIGR